jgi:LysM repeat protein
MNNSNPFVPQGSLLEQKNKTRSRMKLGVFCVLAVSVLGLTAMLIQGCKRETETANTTPEDTNATPTVDTNVSPMEASNPPVTPPVETNPPVVTPPVTTETPTTEYVVVKGDTLGKIAKRNSVTLKALEAANPGVVPTKLKVGQKLEIPAATGGAEPSEAASASSTGGENGEEIYTVKSGDTLTKIARHYGTTIKAIESENNLSTTKIKVGQKLKIPSTATTAAPTAPAPVSPPMTAPNSVPAPASNSAPVQ